MSTASATPTVGELLRDWRRRRRISQFDLSLEAAVSARHLSFVETGRSRPGRDLVLHLAEHLDVPLRERNTLLLAAGYAPVFRETALDAERMAPVRAALEKILEGHAPYPALIVDGCWNVLMANEPALAILAGVDAALLEAPNAMRLALHPDGLASRIENLAEHAGHLLLRLQRQALLSGDPAVAALLDELRGYPAAQEAAATSMAAEPAELLFVPMRLRRQDGSVWSFFSTIASFGTATDITVAELAIESFFPADPQTAVALQAAGRA
ncbi:helix-turn-helix domain-containing protein [Conexibacter sp. W3-3-2]|uniref:Transcriptional regulator n=1 Tax=Paraconexibacter algicola TaxID=2133960 RepID=A0A2T4UEA9_9ACTN|nr:MULTISPECIES: helix-turn-helix transcriptional regulator [Solirubrobacterales]MTD42960.1 helix-turn-helix domain-containing protein [Conexibacter sp. W3-3-2]PTL56111.1 transcriptional regulator [Paraconexibacter algicola]